jgi:predicted outer membrane protein
MNQRIHAPLLAVAALVGFLGGCDHDEPPSATPAPAQLVPPPPPPTHRQMGATMAQPTSAAPAAPAPTTAYGPRSLMIPGSGADLAGLDDGQIAGVVQAIHQADIDHLQVALARAKSSDVQAFARDAIQVHRAAASQDQTDLGRLQIVPISSPASEQVLADWQHDRAALQAAPALDFDRAFVAHHVELDVEAVALLDAAIANVRSPDLKGHLQSDRTSIAGHMREAQHLQQALRPQTP